MQDPRVLGLEESSLLYHCLLTRPVVVCPFAPRSRGLAGGDPELRPEADDDIGGDDILRGDNCGQAE